MTLVSSPFPALELKLVSKKRSAKPSLPPSPALVFTPLSVKYFFKTPGSMAWWGRVGRSPPQSDESRVMSVKGICAEFWQQLVPLFFFSYGFPLYEWYDVASARHEP